jgi:hypothetical protein
MLFEISSFYHTTVVKVSEKIKDLSEGRKYCANTLINLLSIIYGEKIKARVRFRNTKCSETIQFCGEVGKVRKSERRKDGWVDVNENPQKKSEKILKKICVVK